WRCWICLLRPRRELARRCAGRLCAPGVPPHLDRQCAVIARESPSLAARQVRRQTDSAGRAPKGASGGPVEGRTEEDNMTATAPHRDIPVVGPVLNKIFGTRNERFVKRYTQRVLAITALEPQMRALSDAELREKIVEFRQRLK